MRILLKCPTRSRPQKIIDTISSYIRLANHPNQIGVAISCDNDDASMKDTTELQRVLNRCAWHRIYYGDNRNKIGACNANMSEIDWEWDIVVLVSDDMIPTIRGYDDIIRNHMRARFPDRNGILWFNDGFQGDKLNTLCIYGRAFYEWQGFIYCPEYKSLFCDTELTDKCRGEYADRCLYVPYCIIRHEHPGTGYARNMDKLYEINQRYWNEDMYTYIRRKKYAYDWSVLIATIPGREESLRRLVESIHARRRAICPDLKIEICIAFDNKEMSIGMKRQSLLQQAKGRYLSFVDDDDEITDAYLEDLVSTIQGEYSVMRLRGKINQFTFTHSLANKMTDTMARGEVFIRPPNHLNPMMSDIAKMITFRDSHKGEDLDWALRLSRAGFLTKEYASEDSRIHYIYNMGDRTVSRETLEMQSKMTYDAMLRVVWTPNGAEMQPPAPTFSSPILRLGPRGFVSK